MQFSESPEARRYFLVRFDIPEEVLARFRFLRRGRYVWAFSGETLPPVKMEHAGIKALSLAGATPKPTTVFLRVVGRFARRNAVRLSAEEGVLFLGGETIPGSRDAERGYVVVLTGSDVLGCGFYTGEELRSMLPKEYRMEDTWV